MPRCYRNDSKGQQMKTVTATVLTALLAIPLLTTTTRTADAVVYCKYVGFPKGCVVRPAVVRPAYVGVGVGARGVGVTAAPGVGGPLNRGGPVNRIGRR
jgi:hypothetical protein